MARSPENPVLSSDFEWQSAISVRLLMTVESSSGLHLKTLVLQAPSFDGFDGGAGSPYQAKREIKSFWFPTWLAQPAALVPNSRVLDAPADELTVAEKMGRA